MQKYQLKVKGMHCSGCIATIENALKKIQGVENVSVDLNTGLVKFQYDAQGTSLNTIFQAIENEGYSVSTENSSKGSPLQVQWPYLLILVSIGFFIFLNPINIPSIAMLPNEISYLALFLVGVLTSFHCVGMCGGIHLAVTLQNKPNIKQFHLGRLSSYTLIGAFLGATGGFFTPSVTLKALITLFAGFFVAIMGFKMLGFFQFIAVPKLFSFNKVSKIQSNPSSALLLGFLNGFMPCGPLQAMQLYALSTGSWRVGALSMFFFALGTTPLLFGFGVFANSMSKKFNRQLTKASGLLLIVLALLSITRGLALIPVTNSTQATTQQALTGKKATLMEGYQEVVIDVSSRSYQTIILQKDLPARLIFRATSKDLNGCNDGIIIPSLNLQASLSPGDTILELDGIDEGTINYSCWMAMIRSRIHVVSDITQ